MVNNHKTFFHNNSESAKSLTYLTGIPVSYDSDVNIVSHLPPKPMFEKVNQDSTSTDSVPVTPQRASLDNDNYPSPIPSTPPKPMFEKVNQDSVSTSYSLAVSKSPASNRVIDIKDCVSFSEQTAQDNSTFYQDETNESDVIIENDFSEIQQFLYNFSVNLCRQGYMIYYNNRFYFFNGKHHILDEQDNVYILLSSMIKETLKNVTSNDIGFVYKQMKHLAMSYDMVLPNDPKIFLFSNVLVNVDENSTYPHTPMYFATGGISAKFIYPDYISHPNFDKLLNDIAGDDYELKIRIWEVLAYIISPEYRQRVIFCFIGVGGAGKSLLLNIIQNLLSPSLVTNMSMTNLLGGRFAASELINKRVCIASDEANFHFSDREASELKRISGGGETITADVKGKAQQTFVSTAKIAIASNYAIHLSAGRIDTHLKNRMVVIPFVNSIPKEMQDDRLLEKILSERDSIATEAYYIFKQLKNNHFVFSGDNEKYDKMAAYAAGTTTSYNPIVTFSNDYCIFGGDNFTSSEKLYHVFCNNFGEYKDITAFSREFGEVNYGKCSSFRKHTSETNHRGFKGVVLK